jgi:hypothetical protein
MAKAKTKTKKKTAAKKTKARKPRAARKPAARVTASAKLTKAAARLELRHRSRGPNGVKLYPRPAKPKAKRNRDHMRFGTQALVKAAK